MSDERTIIHVDMDAFYASVEQRDDPSLRGKPVLVGGPSRRGVVAAASYEARPFGVRSAMPMAEALRRCPHAIVVAGNHAGYAEVSRQVFAIFRRYTPLVEGLSLDEAFLDVSASRRLFGEGAAIAREIKDTIKRETQLTASAGVGPCKFVAKIGSDLEKPDGLVVVRQDEVVSFLAPLPIERMWGIGPRTAPRAHSAGFHTLGDLARADDTTLTRLFGAWGAEAARLARGEDSREVISERAAKSIGAEETYEHDLRGSGALCQKLLGQCERVAARLLGEGLAARGLTVKLKYADFVVKTRSMKLPEPAHDTDTLYRAARELLARFDLERGGVRLTGVNTSDFVEIRDSRSLFPDPRITRGSKLEAARAEITKRFGSERLTRAALLGTRRRDSRQE